MSLNEGIRKFPLSLSQLNILNLERIFAGTSVNNISTTVRIVGRIDFPVLQQSINLVIESDPPSVPVLLKRIPRCFSITLALKKRISPYTIFQTQAKRV